ncbi:uncharacterized protein [Amphiura filiformis]|uniref:uncharacterized protein n=1 Tax=Amphiura filiformis TaxID=82378 RepID=UPI003B2202AC
MVDIIVSSPTFGVLMQSLSDLREDVDYLANDILAFANSGNLNITMGTDEQVQSDDLENEKSTAFTWTCGSGEKSTLSGCVSCPPGTYLDDTNLCQYCEVGEYNNLAKMTSCTKCPDGTMTNAKGAFDDEHCENPNQAKSTGWNSQLTVIVIITGLLFLILVLATLIICCWKCLVTERPDPYADSLSNLKYLNQAYDDDSTVDARSRTGASNHFIRRQNRLHGGGSNGTTVTGYVMASDDNSRANSRSELVSITDSMSEDYRTHQQRSAAANERHAHFSPRTELINGSPTMNGSVSNGGVASTNTNGSLPNGNVVTISQPARPPTPPPNNPAQLQASAQPQPRSTRREFIPMT